MTDNKTSHAGISGHSPLPPLPASVNIFDDDKGSRITACELSPQSAPVSHTGADSRSRLSRERVR